MPAEATAPIDRSDAGAAFAPEAVVHQPDDKLCYF
jgi:hypothetical protein